MKDTLTDQIKRLLQEETIYREMQNFPAARAVRREIEILQKIVSNAEKTAAPELLTTTNELPLRFECKCRGHNKMHACRWLVIRMARRVVPLIL